MFVLVQNQNPSVFEGEDALLVMYLVVIVHLGLEKIDLHSLPCA